MVSPPDPPAIGLELLSIDRSDHIWTVTSHGQALERETGRAEREQAAALPRIEAKTNMTNMTSRERRAPPSRQQDLFAEPRLAGLSLFEDRVRHAEEQALIAAIDGVKLSPFRFQGWLGKRLTAAYGWSYDFDTGRFAPAGAIPDWLLPLRQTAARLTGLPVDDLVQALLIRYDPGAGIGWHRDRPVFGHIVGVSLGAPATMRFRRRQPDGFDRVAVDLPPRSIYHMTGEARHAWEHSIAPMDEARWSVTFRTLAHQPVTSQGD